MSPTTPAPADVLGAVDAHGPPGTPVTTPEVAEGFDCTRRTVYNRLDALVDDGVLRTKTVGANGRVGWRPVDKSDDGTSWDRGQIRSHRVFDSELVGVVWDEDLAIADASDAFLDVTGLEHEDALGTSWRELTPEEFHADSERHVEQVHETGSGDPHEKQYDGADGSRFWGLFGSRLVD